MKPIGPPKDAAPTLPTIKFADSAREQFARELACLHKSLDKAFSDHKARAVDINLYGIWILINASNIIEKSRRTSLFRSVKDDELNAAGLVAEAGDTYYFYETFGYCFTIVLRENVWHVLHFLRLQERTADGTPGKILGPIDSLKAFVQKILNTPSGPT